MCRPVSKPTPSLVGFPHGAGIPSIPSPCIFSYLHLYLVTNPPNGK